MDNSTATRQPVRKIRQVDKLAEYMQHYSSKEAPVTQLIAGKQLGIGRLAARIGELKEDGFLRDGVIIRPKVEDRFLKVAKADDSVATVKGYWLLQDEEGRLITVSSYTGTLELQDVPRSVPFIKLNDMLAPINRWYIFECTKCGHMNGEETLLVNTSTGNVVCGACEVESEMNIKSRVKTDGDRLF